MKYVKIFLLILFLIISSYFLLFYKFDLKQEDRWDWNSITTDDIWFPANFIWGTADSAFQTEGIETAHGKTIQNSWTAWEEEAIAQDYSLFRIPRIAPENRANKACQRWKYYKEDIQLLKQLGMNAHRFSIEWSKIEPEEGLYDFDALQHYLDYTQEMLNNEIQPIVTLFHHTLPLWFTHKGSFEKTKNIHYFIEFARFIFTQFKKAGLLEKTKLWLTLNEPIGFAFSAYVKGTLPPGKKFHIKKAGTVAKNLLDAHIAIYDIFKTIDPTTKISFAHAMNPIHPYHPWNPFDTVPARIFDYLVNDVALEYFKTGNFYWPKTSFCDYAHAPFLSCYKQQYNPNAQDKIDFVGVNYYSHTLLKMFHEASRPEEKCADGYPVKKIKAIYPEGFYNSIKKAASLGIPILITENGFATHSDELRTEYLKKHLYILYKSMKEGINIRGYLFWTLTDCFGWDSGQKSMHGIYAVDPVTKKRTLKSNVSYLIDSIKTKLNASWKISQF